MAIAFDKPSYRSETHRASTQVKFTSPALFTSKRTRWDNTKRQYVPTGDQIAADRVTIDWVWSLESWEIDRMTVHGTKVLKSGKPGQLRLARVVATHGQFSGDCPDELKALEAELRPTSKVVPQ
jgi:hypothetical protein